ncbi:MAG: TolC family protein [Candidatus Hydrogenedentota bacterium]
MNRICTSLALFAAVLACFLGGCATVSMEEAFEPVKTGTAGRTGQTPEWRDVSATGATVDAAISEALEDGLTADEAVAIALTNNRRLQAVYAEVGIAEAQYVQAGLLKNPTLSGVLYYAPHDRKIWDFEVVTDFIHILMTPMRKQLAEAEREQVRLTVQSEVVGVVADVRRAYYQIQADQQMRELWETVLEATEAAFEMALHLREAGNIPQIAVMGERALFEDAKLRLAAAEAAVVADREHLNDLMGLWGDPASWTITERLPDIPEEAFDTAHIERRVLEQSFDLDAAYRSVETAARRYGIEQVTAVLPEVEVGMAFERERETETHLKKKEYLTETEYELEEERGPEVWWVGPALSLPIPIFDQGQARRALARAEIRQQWDRYTALAVELRTAARLAAYRLRTAREVALSHRDVIVPLRHRITQQTHLRYNGMFVGVFDLLRAKQAEIAAGQRYIESIHAYWMARTDVDQLLMGRALSPGQISPAGMAAGGPVAGGGGPGDGH